MQNGVHSGHAVYLIVGCDYGEGSFGYSGLKQYFWGKLADKTSKESVNEA